MISLKTENIGSVTKDLNKLSKDIVAERESSLLEVGRFVEAEAKLRTPVSPTKAQAKKDPFYSYKKGNRPGVLRDGIKLRKGSGWVDIGVLGANARAYADYIHNQFGKLWHRLGPGSLVQSTGRDVGAKFIDRAYDENKAEIDKMFDDGADHAVERFNN